MDRALTYWLMSCLQVDPDDPKQVYLGTEHSGLFITKDGGKEWLRANPNVPCLTLSSLLAVSGKLFAGTMPAALYALSDSGGWQELKGVRSAATGGTFPPNPDLAARTRVITSEERAGGRLYAGIEVGGILISDDDGRDWSAANDGLEDPDIHQILPSKKTAGLVLAACGEGVFRSKDRGAHWDKITPQGKRTYGNALAEDDSGTIYLGITLDRPRTWTRSGRADGAIYKTNDGGKCWEPIVENISGGVMDICVEPDGNGVLVATAEGEVLHVDSSASRAVISGLPCVTALARGA
ncbi:MAG: WD40/YVTN/BNR-like repeat-containing protein [Candidatus Binatia bacterium]